MMNRKYVDDSMAGIYKMAVITLSFVFGVLVFTGAMLLITNLAAF